MNQQCKAMAQEVNGSKRPKQVKNPSPHRVLERHTRGGTGAYVCVFSTLLFLVSELALALQMEFIWFSLSRSYPYGRSCLLHQWGKSATAGVVRRKLRSNVSK